MNRNILTLLILVLFFSCSKNGIEDRECIAFNIPDAYHFPIRPGSTDWQQLGSLTEKIEVCQIPDSILNNISTEGLLETLLNYPLILDYTAFNTMQGGFYNIKSVNNGFNELYKRNDLFEVILERYELMSLNCEGDLYPPFILGDDYTPITIPFKTYELFIFQDELLDSINENERILIFEEVYTIHNLKIKNGYSVNSCNTTTAILGKIMYKNNFIPFVDYCNETEFIKFFIESIPTYRPENLSPLDIITEYAKEYHNDL